MVPIEIIFKNENWLVVDKPAGLVTTKENHNNYCVEDWVRENYPNGLPREGIVHRLDKGTSGLLMIARNKRTLEKLQRLFKGRKVTKKYLALVSEVFPFEAEVDMPIGRSRYNFESFGVNEDGKNARTVFKRLKVVEIEGRKYSLIEADLKTGRTHQIRVHLKYLRYPIVGDKLYGAEMPKWVSRIFLHSYFLKIDGLEYKSKLPEDLNELVGYE